MLEAYWHTFKALSRVVSYLYVDAADCLLDLLVAPVQGTLSLGMSALIRLALGMNIVDVPTGTLPLLLDEC